MSTPKHTSGPWIPYDNGNGISITLESAKDALVPSLAAARNKIAHCLPPEPWNDHAWGEIKANAKLMAAAPDLLVALEIILASPADLHPEIRKLAQDALSKAQGK